MARAVCVANKALLGAIQESLKFKVGAECQEPAFGIVGGLMSALLSNSSSAILGQPQRSAYTT